LQAAARQLSFYCDDANDAGRPDELLFEGAIHFDAAKDQWYVVIDENSYRHASDPHSPLRDSE